jgi:hypothetical protein
MEDVSLRDYRRRFVRMSSQEDAQFSSSEGIPMPKTDSNWPERESYPHGYVSRVEPEG